MWEEPGLLLSVLGVEDLLGGGVLFEASKSYTSQDFFESSIFLPLFSMVVTHLEFVLAEPLVSAL